MKTYPKGFDGRQTTKEEWDEYEMKLHNFRVRLNTKHRLLAMILDYANEYGIDNTRRHFTSVFNKESSMNAPNKPGYYRANND